MSLNMVVYLDNYGFSLTNYMIGILGMILILAGIKTRSLSYVTCAAVFGIYLLFLIHRTFFPLHISGNFADMMKAAPFMVGVNLIPFKFSNVSDLYNIVRELALNLVLLIPFGFGIRFLVSFRTKDVLWLALTVGCSIEAIQLVISLIIGYPYRVIDINDVIMNTLGFLTGYGLFRLFVWLYILMTHRFQIAHVGLGKYIYTIAIGTTDQENAKYNRFDESVKPNPLD